MLRPIPQTVEHSPTHQFVDRRRQPARVSAEDSEQVSLPSQGEHRSWQRQGLTRTKTCSILILWLIFVVLPLLYYSDVMPRERRTTDTYLREIAIRYHTICWKHAKTDVYSWSWLCVCVYSDAFERVCSTDNVWHVIQSFGMCLSRC